MIKLKFYASKTMFGVNVLMNKKQIANVNIWGNVLGISYGKKQHFFKQ